MIDYTVPYQARSIRIKCSLRFCLTAMLASLALSAAAAQVPSATQISHLRLHDGFTLVYQVTVQDMRTKAMREKDVADQRSGIAQVLAAGHLSKQAAADFDKQATALGQARPPEQFAVTLSARDGKLLYLSTRSAPGRKPVGAILLDGDRGYDLNGVSGTIFSDKGDAVDRLAFCPLPGVGLPGIALIQSPVFAGKTADGHFLFAGLVPRLNLKSSESPYKAGTVEAASAVGRLKVLSFTLGPAAAPEQTWRIGAYRLMQDHWVGARMQWTAFETGQPATTADFVLTEAQESALDASAFNESAYLRNGAEVVDDSGSVTFAFPYDRLDGSLKEQVERAHRDGKVAWPKKKSLPTP